MSKGKKDKNKILSNLKALVTDNKKPEAVAEAVPETGSVELLEDLQTGQTAAIEDENISASEYPTLVDVPPGIINELPEQSVVASEIKADESAAALPEVFQSEDSLAMAKENVKGEENILGEESQAKAIVSDSLFSFGFRILSDVNKTESETLIEVPAADEATGIKLAVDELKKQMPGKVFCYTGYFKRSQSN